MFEKPFDLQFSLGPPNVDYTISYGSDCSAKLGINRVISIPFSMPFFVDLPRPTISKSPTGDYIFSEKNPKLILIVLNWIKAMRFSCYRVMNI